MGNVHKKLHQNVESPDHLAGALGYWNNVRSAAGGQLLCVVQRVGRLERARSCAGVAVTETITKRAGRAFGLIRKLSVQAIEEGDAIAILSLFTEGVAGAVGHKKILTQAMLDVHKKSHIKMLFHVTRVVIQCSIR